MHKSESIQYFCCLGSFYVPLRRLLLQVHTQERRVPNLTNGDTLKIVCVRFLLLNSSGTHFPLLVFQMEALVLLNTAYVDPREFYILHCIV